jgi:hypothetical protein
MGTYSSTQVPGFLTVLKLAENSTQLCSKVVEGYITRRRNAAGRWEGRPSHETALRRGGLGAVIFMSQGFRMSVRPDRPLHPYSMEGPR